MDLRRLLGQGVLQGLQGQALIETAPQVPAADAAREDIHDDRQLHKLLTQADRGAIRDPDLRRCARSLAAPPG
jgi:hypothetical protein